MNLSEQKDKAAEARLSDLLCREAELRAGSASQQEAAAASREQHHAEVAALQLEVADVNQKLQSMISERAQLEQDKASAKSKLNEEASNHQQQLSILRSNLEVAEKSEAERNELQSFLKDKESMILR